MHAASSRMSSGIPLSRRCTVMLLPTPSPPNSPLLSPLVSANTAGGGSLKLAAVLFCNPPPPTSPTAFFFCVSAEWISNSWSLWCKRLQGGNQSSPSVVGKRLNIKRSGEMKTWSFLWLNQREVFFFFFFLNSCLKYWAVGLAAERLRLPYGSEGLASDQAKKKKKSSQGWDSNSTAAVSAFFLTTE